MNRPDPSQHDAPFYQFDRPTPRSYTLGAYLRRAVWRGCERTLFRWSPPRCFGWRRFLLRRFGARVGRGCRIAPSVEVTHPWLLTLGDRCTLGDRVRVYNLGRISLGDHSVVSQGAHLCAGTHDYRDPGLPLIRAEIHIGPGVWVAADAFVGPGVSLGGNCVVAARSVVVGDVPAGALVGGNPAGVIRADARS